MHCLVAKGGGGAVRNEQVVSFSDFVPRGLGPEAGAEMELYRHVLLTPL